MRPIMIPIAFALTAIPLTALAQDADPFGSNPGRASASSDQDPFADNSSDRPSAVVPGTIEEGAPYNIEIRYETFSLPLAAAAALSRQSLPDSQLYAVIVAQLEDNKARQERLTVIRVSSGQKATSESITEVIYPTEFEPPELPNTVGVQIVEDLGKDAPAQVPDAGKLTNAPTIDELSGLRTPATPTAFETRNVGHTLEIEPVCGEHARVIDLRIAPENVALVGEFVAGQGLSETKVPEFETQKLSLGVTVVAGVPHLLGTVSRPPVSKADPDSANTTWFAFVTARPVLPE